VLAATAAVQYSENAISLLDETDGLSLMPQINILLDPKYKTVASQDQAFEDAREGAQMTLAMLKDDAVAKETEVKDILASMIAMRRRYVSSIYMQLN
jgi:hypothetical protein